MATNRKKKEDQRSSGNGASFGDIERQQREEAQRQIQSVSRGSRKQADQTMGNIIEQQNQEARQQVQQTNNVYKDADKYIDATAEYAKEGFADLPENLTRTVDKRGTGKVGDDLLSEIASGHSLEALEQAQRAEESGDLAINAGKQYIRGLISAGTGIYDAAEGYTRVEEALMSPEAQYQAYVLANQGINPANTEGYGTVEEGNKYFNDLIQGYQNSELRAGLNEAYNALENEMSDTMVGQALESAGRQTPRGLLTAALGTAGAGVLSKPALDALQKTASLGIMGAEVAGQDMYRTLTDEEHDYTAQQALAHGLASAGGEILTENLDKIPIIKDIPILVNSSVTGQAMGLKDLIGEGYEEYVNQRLDPFINMTLQDNSNGQWAGNAWNALKEAYSAENTAQAFKAGAEGALSAAFTSGITNPAQTVSQWQEDIQNLQNLPSDITRAATQTMNQIRGTNEYEKALKQSLIDDQQNMIDAQRPGIEAMNAGEAKTAAQQELDRRQQELDAQKEAIWEKYIGKDGENLRSNDPLVKEAAWAANTDRTVKGAMDVGFTEREAQVTAKLSNYLGQVINTKSRNSIKGDVAKAINGFFDPVTGNITVLSGTIDPLFTVSSHEVGHSLDGTVEFEKFLDYVGNAIDNGKINATINGITFKKTGGIRKSISINYLNDFLQGQALQEYNSLFNKDGQVIDYGKLNEFLKRDDIQSVMQSEDFQNMVRAEIGGFLTQVTMGTEEAIDYLVGQDRNVAQKLLDGIKAVKARITNNEAELNELDRQKTLRKAVDMFEKALSEDVTYSDSEIGQERQARDLTNKAFDQGKAEGNYKYLKLLTDGGVEAAIADGTINPASIAGAKDLKNYLQKYLNKYFEVQEDGRHVWFDYKKELREYVYSGDARNLRANDPNLYDAKVQIATNLGELIEVARDGQREVAKHTNAKNPNKKKYGVIRYNTTFGIPIRDANGHPTGNYDVYDADLIVEMHQHKNGGALPNFYDLVNIRKSSQHIAPIAKSLTASTNTLANQGNKSSGSTPAYSRNLVDTSSDSVKEFVEDNTSWDYGEDYFDATNLGADDNNNPAIALSLDSTGFTEDDIMGQAFQNAIDAGLDPKRTYKFGNQNDRSFTVKNEYIGDVEINGSSLSHSRNRNDMHIQRFIASHAPEIVSTAVPINEFDESIEDSNSTRKGYILVNEIKVDGNRHIVRITVHNQQIDEIENHMYSVTHEKKTAPATKSLLYGLPNKRVANLLNDVKDSRYINNLSRKTLAKFGLTQGDNKVGIKGQLYSRNLLSEDDLARVSPLLVQRNNSSSFEDYKIPVKDGKIDTRAIDDDVWDKAVEITRNQKGDSEFTKRVYKKNKRVSDMAWISNILQQAQVQVDDDNRKALGAEAFGGKLGYDQLMEKLRDKEGIRNAEMLVDRYLKAIDHTGTANADRMIQSDPNGAKVAKEIKLRLSRDYVNDLQQAQNATIEKRNKARNEGMVYGTEAYWRKTLKAEKENTENRIREILPETHQEVDIPVHRMSPMKMYRDYGTDDVHSPISDARQFLRANGITRTGDYTDFLKRIFLDTAEGRAHDPSMMSRFRDSILNNKQLASSSRMADGGFEYMIEQMDNAARDIMEAEKHMGEYGSYEEFANDNFTHAAVVPLTYDDHTSLGTRTWISGLLGTTANDPVVEQTVKAAESVIREASTDKYYDRTRPSTTEPYAKKLAEMCPLDTDDAQKVIDAAWNDMKYDHGRNSRGQYVNAPTQAEIDEATSERKALSAARTREYFANKDSLEQMIEDAAANEEDLMMDDEYMDLYDQVFNDKQGKNDLTSAYGEENYLFPSDEDAPEPTVKQKTQSAIQGIGLSDNEYEEATKDVDQGYGIKAEDYVPGKLESEMDEDDRSEARKRAEAMKEDIDIWMGEGQNLGSMAKSQEQNRDQMADGNQKVNDAIKRIVEDPFYEAKKAMFEHYKESVKKLSYITDKLGIAAGSDDSKYLQWYMEKSRDTNAENQREVMYTLADLKQDSKNWEKIVEAAKILEEMYDDYYTRINEALEMIYPEKAILEEEKKIREMIENQIAEKQAYLEKLINDKASKKEIQRYRNEIKQLSKKYNDVSKEVRLNKRLPLRQNYVHHFQDVKPTVKNIWGAFMDVIKNEGSNNISNQLADISEWTQPNARWWGAMQQRNNGEYTPDAIGGMLRYMDRAEQKIFIDPYTAYMRGVIREMKNAADEAGRDMSTTIRYYSAWVNDLAGKTNPYDRWLTYAANGKGRQVLTLLKMMNSRVKSNAVMGNLNSAIAQFYNLPNGIAIMQEKGGAKAVQDWTKGLAEYTTDLFSPDRAVDESVFLTERFFDDFTAPLADMTTPQKFTAAMMEFGDRAVAEQIWYAAKAQGERLGVSNPVQYADEITRRSVAGRGIGEVALQQKSEVVKILAPFQVEVNNQWQLMKHLVGEKQAASLFGLFLSTFLMNILKKKVTNTEGTGFDLFAAILDAFKENDTARDTIFGLMGNVAGETLSNMTMGALISELAGLGGDGFTSYFGEHDPTRYGIGNIGLSGMIKPAAQVLSGNADKVDWTKLITNYGMPYGGRQAERTVKTLQDMGYIPHFGNGVYGLKEGAYTSSGKLKYMIDKSDPVDVVRSLLFGSYASKAGSDYLENRSALGDSSVQVMDALVGNGADSYDAWQTMKSLKEVEYPAGVTNAKGLATRKALEDAGLWDEWSEAYMNAEDQDAFRSGTNGIGKKVAAMDDDEFQRAYDEIFGTGTTETSVPAAEEESLPAGTESAPASEYTFSPSRQQAYDTVTSIDGIDSEALGQTMSSLESRNFTDADGNKIDNSKSAVNRLAYEEDGSYQIIVDFIESDENRNADDPLTYADFGLSKTVVNMSDEEYEELLEQINESTGSTYTRKSGGSSRGNSRRSNAFRMSGTSAVRSMFPNEQDLYDQLFG